MKKRKLVLCCLLCFSLFSFCHTAWAENEAAKIMVIDLEDTVEPGLTSYLERNFAAAEQEQVDSVILIMDTPGGRVDAAQDIKRLIYSTDLQIVALVKDQALSAGAYIALACDKIAMMPGSTLGDAEMLVNGVTADEKYMSPWREEFAALAEEHGRDPQIARAFVDREIAVDGVVEAGKLLTLTPQRAVDLGMADYQVADLNALLQILGYENAEIIYGDMTGAERVTRFLTSPLVAPILLGIGILFLVIEIFTAGFGVFGVMGIGLLAAYFGGHMIAGMASWIAVLLFITGLILCLIEILVPGFGIFAIGGVGCIVGSIFLTTPDLNTAIRYTVIVLLIILLSAPILLKLLSKSKLFDRLLIKETLTTEKGYTARKQDLNQFVGVEGIALTVLRPAGTIELEDGTRLDVVTRGDFIEPGEPVVVKAIDGTWLIVEKRRIS